MTITRRAAVKAIASAFALPALSPFSSVFAQSNPEWSTYEIVTEINLESPNGIAQAWIPLPLILDTDYFKTLGINSESTDPKAVIQINKPV